MTQIFDSYRDFISRKDKKVSGLSKYFSLENPFLEEMNKEFHVDLVHILKIVSEYSLLTVDGVKDHAGLKKLTGARQELKGIRIKVDKRRKELNSGLLDEMRANNKAAKYIIGEFLPTELILREREREVKNKKEEIRLEKKRVKMERLQGRINSLNAFEMPFEISEIESLTERQFTKFLAQAEILFMERKVVKEQNAKKMAEETSRIINENPDLRAKIENVNLDEFTESNVTINLPFENIPDVDISHQEKDEMKLLIHFYIESIKNIPIPYINYAPSRIIFQAGIDKIEEGIKMLLDFVK